MAPVAGMANVSEGLLKIVSDLKLDNILDDLGYTVMFSDSQSTLDMSAYLCEMFSVFCEGLEDLVLYHSEEDDDQVAYLVSEGHEPSGASVRSINHYSELIRQKKFVRLDNGEEYNLNNIKFPVALFAGKDDPLATIGDVAILKALFTTNNVLHFYQEYDHVSHSTFLLAKEGQSSFLDDIIKCVNDFKE